MTHFHPRLPGPQGGTAALAVALVLLFSVTAGTLFLQRGLLFEQKTSANHFRATLAFELAEAGIEWATGQLNDPRKIDLACNPDPSQAQSFRQRYLAPRLTNSDPPLADFAVPLAARAGCRVSGSTLSCSCPLPGQPLGFPASASSAEPSFSVVFSRQAAGTEAVMVTAYGCVSPKAPCIEGFTHLSDATAKVRTLLKLKPGWRSVPPAALTTGGSARICGPYRLENTERGTLGGVVNAGHHIEIGVSYKTGDTGMAGCGSLASEPQIVTLPGTPAPHALLSGDAHLRELAASGETLFASHFGTPVEQYKSQARLIAGGTAASRAQALRRDHDRGYRNFWIEGDSHFEGNEPVGSTSEPVSIASFSKITVSGNTDFYGLLYFDSAEWQSSGTGNSNLRGALLTRGNFSSNATGSLIYSPTVLFSLRPLSGTLVRVPGSWQDF